MKISDQTIYEIKRNIPPEAAIERYTGSAGKRGRWLCPFHNDTNPSISVKGNRWTCWACSAGGDVIDFTMRFFSIGFRDAVARLGADFGIMTIEPEAETEEQRQRRIEFEKQREEARKHKEYLDQEIDKLTACHRALVQCGAPEDVLNRYAAEIDNLIIERG